jgi:hypothetical protein
MSNHDFRDRLIGAQELTPEYREKYERSLESMLTRQLTPSQRAGLWFAVVLGLVISAVAVFAMVAIKELPDSMRAVLGFLGLVMLVVTALRARAAIMGTVDLRWQPKVTAYVGFYGVLIAIAAIAGYGALHTNLHSIHVMVVWIIPLVVVTGKLIGTHIEQSELAIREKLLEIELRLEEVSEQLAKTGQ